MMQELLGGSNVGIIGGGDRSKGFFDGQSPSPSSSSAAAAAAAAAESLRCPRCDSPNTKFCYYNNYNLTQPRHFCKTCRRYWTKGGALRNVPIGGGCRKNKSATIAAAVAKSGVAGKLKSLSSEIGRSAGGFFSGGFDHHEQAAALSSNPTLWAPSQNSHILSLLRANQNLNNYPSTHLTNSVKEDGLLFGSSMNARTMGFDPVDPTHLPYMGLSNSSYRTQTDQPSNQGFGHGNSADQNNNNGLLFQELYQKFRPTTTTTTNYYPDQNGPIILGHVASATCSMNSSILESAPVSAGELGFWNNSNNNNNNATLSWATDFPTSL
ncbi:hypothetical protein ABFS83_08G045500 [Erythranthe nasuta]